MHLKYFLPMQKKSAVNNSLRHFFPGINYAVLLRQKRQKTLRLRRRKRSTKFAPIYDFLARSANFPVKILFRLYPDSLQHFGFFSFREWSC